MATTPLPSHIPPNNTEKLKFSIPNGCGIPCPNTLDHRLSLRRKGKELERKVKRVSFSDLAITNDKRNLSFYESINKIHF